MIFHDYINMKTLDLIPRRLSMVDQEYQEKQLGWKMFDDKIIKDKENDDIKCLSSKEFLTR